MVKELIIKIETNGQWYGERGERHLPLGVLLKLVAKGTPYKIIKV